MAELTQAATVLSVNDLTPHTRQLVLLPTVTEHRVSTRSMGFPQAAGRCQTTAQSGVFDGNARHTVRRTDLDLRSRDRTAWDPTISTRSNPAMTYSSQAPMEISRFRCRSIEN